MLTEAFRYSFRIVIFASYPKRPVVRFIYMSSVFLFCTTDSKQVAADQHECCACEGHMGSVSDCMFTWMVSEGLQSMLAVLSIPGSAAGKS